MGLAITIGAVIALTVALLLWCRGAMAASERRHKVQVEANARRAALLEKTRAGRLRAERTATDRLAYLDAERARQRSTIATAYARPKATEDYSPAYSPPAYSSYDYGSSSSDSYSGGGSCSSDGGGGGGGCD